MLSHEVTLVRIYLREAEYLLGKVINYLHDEAKVSGVTVLRGVEGFSDDGKVRTVSLMNLSLDLPLVIEFYDETEKAKAIVAKLVGEMHLPHVISFPVTHYRREA